MPHIRHFLDDLALGKSSLNYFSTASSCLRSKHAFEVFVISEQYVQWLLRTKFGWKEKEAEEEETQLGGEPIPKILEVGTIRPEQFPL